MKKKDLTDTFEHLAKSGKRMNIMVRAIQRKIFNSLEPLSKKNSQRVLARLSRLSPQKGQSSAQS